MKLGRGYDGHFLNSAQVIGFVEAAFPGLAAEELQIRFLLVELADADTGQMPAGKAGFPQPE